MVLPFGADKHAYNKRRYGILRDSIAAFLYWLIFACYSRSWAAAASSRFQGSER